MRNDNIKNRAAPRWFAAWRSPVPSPAQDDPADLGTAFGLDLSLHQQPADLSDAELRALRAANAPLPAARPHASSSDSAPQPGWVQRLGASRKPAL